VSFIGKVHDTFGFDSTVLEGGLFKLIEGLSGFSKGKNRWTSVKVE
jgi:hypothetical protein